MTKPKGTKNGESWRFTSYVSDFKPGTVKPNYPPPPPGFRRAEVHSIVEELDLIERRTEMPLSEQARR